MTASAEGKRVRELREARNISQAQLAAYTGYSTTYVRAVENGRRNLSEKARGTFAEHLDTTPAELLQARGVIGQHDVSHAEVRAILQQLTIREILLLKYGKKVARLADAFNDTITLVQGRQLDE